MVLAIRDRKMMHGIVSINKSAFIKVRSIHDNYLLVRQVARKIHASKVSGTFLKLDISRAFDSLNWPFLFEVLKRRGFARKWLHWVSTLLSTTCTKIIANGVPSRPIAHAQGLTQGDPISPLIFVIAMDSLSAILCKATEIGVLISFRYISPLQRLSVYADDVAMFIRPTNMDLISVRELLDIFGEASGLRINYTKSVSILIRGSEEDGVRVTDVLHCRLNKFSCKYLGIPMTIEKLSRAHWQPLPDQFRKLIHAWQCGMIGRPGRLRLAKPVISARPIHQLLVLNVSTWIFEEIDKWMKAFF
ncbi:hypothetical protein D1007_35372 [Hordeum vulgare]|nr:hypothetical protein D1007_35372 [Hordeum vulgare]